MSKQNPVGLGEPEIPGKRSLFRPPIADEVKNSKIIITQIGKQDSNLDQPQQHVRTSIMLTPQALKIIQDVQREYRLQSGKSMPMWKAICELIERSG